MYARKIRGRMVNVSGSPEAKATLFLLKPSVTHFHYYICPAEVTGHLDAVCHQVHQGKLG